MSVTQKEIAEALTGPWLVPDGVDEDAWIALQQAEMAVRIEDEGIAPPEGYAIVPIGKLNEIHHWMLNAERVFKRDFSNHKFMGFDLMERTINSVSDMLTAAPKPEDL